MSAGRNRGLVQTVLGTVQPSELGAATTHEHLYIDFSFMYRPAQDTPSPELADAPITLENLGWIRRNYYSNRANLTLLDLDTLVDEVGKFSKPAEARSWTRPRRRSAATRRPWPAYPASPASTSSWARATTWKRCTRRTWACEASTTWPGR